MKLVETLLSLLISAGANASELVGTTAPPYPDGLRETGGTCIGSSLQPHKICEYAVGFLANSSGENQLLVAQREFARSENHAVWRITDAIAYPQVPDGYYLAIGTCRVGSSVDDTVSAVVKVTESEWFEHAVWARQLNLTTGKFAEIPAAEVSCLNEGDG